MNRLDRGWSKTEAANALGITPRTVHFYTDAGIVIPEKANPKGKGTTRKYSAKNLFEILISRELAQLGISLARIKEAIRFLDRTGETSRVYGDIHQDPSLPGSWRLHDQEGTRCYLIAFDIQTDLGHFALMFKKDNDPVDVDMRDIHRRYSTAIVLDVTGLLDKVKKFV